MRVRMIGWAAVLTLVVAPLGAAADTVDDGGAALVRPDLRIGAAETAVDPEDAERIRRLVKTRRGMMTAHQILSIALLPVAGATAVMGTVNRAMIDAGEPISAGQLNAHRALAISSGGMYVTTGLLAITAPHPYRGLAGTSGASGKMDSSKVHAQLAIVHAMIFGALIATGLIDRYAPLPPEAYQVINKVHLVEGWAWFTLVAISGVTISFY